MPKSTDRLQKFRNMQPAALREAGRPFLVLLPLSLAAWCSITYAIGLGQVNVVSRLGQPLLLELPVHGLEDPQNAARCVKADIGSLDGSVFIPVRTLLLTKGEDSLLQIRSTKTVNEPILSVMVSMGCDSPVRREYQVLMDMPQGSEAIAGASQAELAMPRNDKQLAAAARVAPEEGARVRQTASREDMRRERAPREKRRMTAKASHERARDAGTAAPIAILPVFAPFGLRLSTTLSVIPADIPASQENVAAQAPASASVAAASASASTQAIQATTASQAIQATPQPPQVSASRSAASVPALATTEPALRESNQNLLHWVQGLAAALAASFGGLLWMNRKMRRERELLEAEFDAHLFDDIEDGEEGREEDVQGESFAEPAILRPEPLQVENQQDAVNEVDAQRAVLGTAAPAAPDWLSLADDANSLSSASVAEQGGADNGQKRGFKNELLNLTSPEEISDLIELAETWLALNRPKAVIEILGPLNHVETPRSPLPWLYLMNAYRQVGDRASFDDLRLRTMESFNVDVPDWSSRHAVVSYPGNCLTDFPHITERIIALWNTPEVVPYLESLLPDDRKGIRQGFPLAVYQDILGLIHLASAPDREIAESGVPDDVMEIIHRKHPDSEAGTKEPLAFADFELDDPGPSPDAAVADVAGQALSSQQLADAGTSALMASGTREPLSLEPLPLTLEPLDLGPAEQAPAMEKMEKPEEPKAEPSLPKAEVTYIGRRA
ncbi:type IV pilus assembly protein FimV [Noviherbaspirillum galbum]|uniref:FimV N-terminal domain-containing protein n=1 Tax=Noviherbaspirillum galbum TaxID=2709383 RepID=A0A6B3SG82_9BURK|nr:hypothetical protein [Noviherbaspirillum galbum]NEX59630.1 hypothetical protein [Noviherbaspirillum galbum]